MKHGFIADDAAVMRIRLKEILEKDYDIIGEAGDRVEAVQMFGELNLDACIVIVSAVGQKQLVLKGLSLGAKNFIVKPFERDYVLKSINRLFE